MSSMVRVQSYNEGSSILFGL